MQDGKLFGGLACDFSLNAALLLSVRSMVGGYYVSGEGLQNEELNKSEIIFDHIMQSTTLRT